MMKTLGIFGRQVEVETRDLALDVCFATAIISSLLFRFRKHVTAVFVWFSQAGHRHYLYKALTRQDGSNVSSRIVPGAAGGDGLWAGSGRGQEVQITALSQILPQEHSAGVWQ